MKKYMSFITLTAIAILVIFFSLFTYMRYATYKSPSTNLQGKASPLEKKIFDAIDWLRGGK